MLVGSLIQQILNRVEKAGREGIQRCTHKGQNIRLALFHEGRELIKVSSTTKQDTNTNRARGIDKDNNKVMCALTLNESLDAHLRILSFLDSGSELMQLSPVLVMWNALITSLSVLVFAFERNFVFSI